VKGRISLQETQIGAVTTLKINQPNSIGKGAPEKMCIQTGNPIVTV
jgi:hypothetical protein